MEWIPPSLALLLLIVLLASASVRRAAGEQRARRLAVIDHKLNLILDHLGIREPVPDELAGVLDELMAGRRVQAIRAYREVTDATLKEAKEAVELLARRHGLG